MNTPEWKPMPAPEDVALMTRIDDDQGVRNEAMLKRQGNLWFFADDSMYVYYRPTHWRELTESEKSAARESLLLKAQQALTAARNQAAAIR